MVRYQSSWSLRDRAVGRLFRAVLSFCHCPNETGGTRTHDLSIKSAVLYQLSYDLRISWGV